MRVALISGGRSDRGQLRVVYDEMRASEVDAWWVDLTHCQPVAEGGPAACAIRAGVATRETVAELVSLQPDWVMVLGDRYEILGATVGAYVAGFPIAHLSGGDITEGSQDDCMRHAISKLAHIHFPDNEDSAKRIVQMGEDPSRVHVVGCPEVDRIMRTKLLSREEALKAVGLPVTQKSLLVCLHPNTLDATGDELNSLYGALSGLSESVSLILTGPNQDAGSGLIKARWRQLADERLNTVYRDEWPEELFLSLLKHCDALVGNSSVGFYEAPSFGTPAINIGDRQKGRALQPSLIQCMPNYDSIRSALDMVLSWVHYKDLGLSPYGDGQASKRITDILKSIDDPKSYLRKSFYCADISEESYPHLATS